MKETRDTVPSALFDDLLLYFCDGPATDGVVGGRVRSVCRRFNSHGQLVYRIAHRLAEFVKFLSIHSPVQGLTDIGTE